MSSSSSTTVSSSPSKLLKQWLLLGHHSSAQTQQLPRILLLDGGVSTHLESQGATFAHRALWSSSLLLTEPQRIRRGHVDWLDGGGVNLISTVTYQCHYEPTLWPDVIRDDTHMDDLWRQAVGLAQEAVEEQCAEENNHDSHLPQRYRGIVASSGCFGAALANGAEYTGDYLGRTVEDLQRFHARKIQTMTSLEAVDGMAIETVPSLAECQALRDLLTSDTGTTTAASGKACWISLSCRNGHELNDGTPVTRALDILDEIPVDAVQAFGFNCCHAEHLPSLLQILVQHYQQQKQKASNRRRRAIVLYPNSGETWNAERQDWEPGTECADMASHLMRCIRQIERDMGEDECRIIVGGCCRSTPDTLAALRKQVDEYLREN